MGMKIKSHYLIRIFLGPYHNEDETVSLTDHVKDEYIPNYDEISVGDLVSARIVALRAQYPNLREVRLIENATDRVDELLWHVHSGAASKVADPGPSKWKVDGSHGEAGTPG